MTKDEAIAEALAEVKGEVIDHEDAWQLAIVRRWESNLARCYLDLLSKRSHAAPDTLTAPKPGEPGKDI